MVLSNKHVHQATIEKALTEYDDVDDKIIIYSGNYKNLVSKRILIMFSPVMKSLIASLPCCTPASIIIPDFSSAVVQHLVRILETGSTTGVQSDSFKQVYEIIEVAKVFSIDVSDLRHDVKVLQDKKVEKKNVQTEENNEISLTKNDMALEIKSKGDKVADDKSDENFDVETSKTEPIFDYVDTLKTHKQSMHEGVKYSCNQCEYQATNQGNLKRHKQSHHKDQRC